ncbi:MAG: hypothetical protein U5N85_09950 [Arcicella sp.]|nr:hypothetical protein [Arcicella sp.]
MKQLFLILFLTIFYFEGKAQSTLSKKDMDEIRLLARKKIQKSLPELINTLNLDDVSFEDRKEVAQNSYYNNPEQLFAGDSVLIDDDLNPARKIGNKTSRIKVSSYLAKSDSVYKKSAEPTYEVSNIVVSEIKDTNNIISIKVFFRSLFKGTHITIKERYKPCEQIAKFKVEKIGKRWQVWISDISLNEAHDNGNESTSKVLTMFPPLLL